MNRYFDGMNPTESDVGTANAPEHLGVDAQITREIPQRYPNEEHQTIRISQPMQLTPGIPSGSNPECQPYSRYLRSKSSKTASFTIDDIYQQRDRAAQGRVSNLQGVFSNSTSKEFHSPLTEVSIPHPLKSASHHEPDMTVTIRGQIGHGAHKGQDTTFADNNAYPLDEGERAFAKEIHAGARDNRVHQKSISRVFAHPERFSFGAKEAEDVSAGQIRYGQTQDDSLVMTAAQFEEYNQLLKIRSGLISVISRSRSDKDALHQANQLLLKKIDQVADRLHAKFNSSN